MNLRCVDCGTILQATEAVCACGGPLDVDESAWERPAITREDYANPRTLGVSRFARVLAMPRGRSQRTSQTDAPHPSRRGVPREAWLTFGEAATPLAHSRAFDAHMKMEYLQPTGSFKDRGAAALLTAARALGATRVVEDSSGNAGQSVSAYAARAGLPATIFAPAAAHPAKVARMRALGADVRLVEGSRAGVTRAAIAFCDATEGAYFASHAYPPWFLEGTRTMAYELAEDHAFRGPTDVVAPCSMGTVLLGLVRGFRDLVDAGLLDAMPRLHAGQAAGFAPVVRALGGSEPADANTLPDGILIPEPPRLRQLVDAVKGTGGSAVALTEDEVRAAQATLHSEGFLVEPTGAVGPAALAKLRDADAIDRDARVAVVLTGGVK